MKKSTIVGYPRIGANRELKFAVEAYFKGNCTEKDLCTKAENLRKEYLTTQREKGINLIPSNDFSYYDNMLDMAFLLNVVPQRYKELGLSKLDTYFAMARGYQKDGKDVKALAMKKWFNTNYHYIVPEIDDDTVFEINDSKPFDLYRESKTIGIDTKPVIIGIFTFLKLSNLKTSKSFESCITEIEKVYEKIFDKFESEGINYLQIDEPILCTDLSKKYIELFKKIYIKLLSKNHNFKVILQTYFGDIRDLYPELNKLNFDAVGLDFIEGKYNLKLIQKYGFPKNTILIAGIVNGKNIWVDDYKKSLEFIKELEKHVNSENIFIGTSCSLLHVPYTVKNEKKLDEKYKESLAFAEEKLEELKTIIELSDNTNYKNDNRYLKNQDIIQRKRTKPVCFNKEIREKVEHLSEEDFHRKKDFEERRKVQKNKLKLPILPTTTIGSFPQTKEIKDLRKQLREGTICQTKYEEEIKERIKEVITFQEKIGLDVIVHGEYERNDMVEYFGKLLNGFLFTENGWVQSYGTRCVKPPVIYGDVKRTSSMTVKWIRFAQTQTSKPVKGMLTGPITILNWSFPREDLELKQIAYQIGLAIGEEVLDLEANGIKIIQIDEAALREKLPLRKANWNTQYLDWAIPAFRLTNAKVKDETQIHTHMCYSEFTDIIKEIEAMDADVISIEAARSDFSLLDFLKKVNFKLEIGPGVYDIHSPRVPSQAEIENLIKIMLDKVNLDKLWVNPDCGLKTRGTEETETSLINMVKAAKAIRKNCEVSASQDIK